MTRSSGGVDVPVAVAACRGVVLGGLVVGLLATAVPVADAAPAATSRRPDHVVLMVRGSAAALDGAASDARNERAHVRQELPEVHAISIGVPPGRQLALQRKLARRGLVVEPVRRLQKADVPDDASYASQQPYLDAIGASSAWTTTHGSSSVKLAVIDSGMNVSHPDLAGKVVATRNVVTGTSNVADADGHGTMVGGMAAAATDNATGIAGTGWDTRLMAVKVADASGFISGDDVVEGILWAANNGAKVINISLGAPGFSQAEADAVKYAQSKGAVVVAAAGNLKEEELPGPIYPAAYGGVLAVGALDSSTTRASFSNFGSWVDLAAPGVGIWGTIGTDSYDDGAGTSFSSPLVAGAVALLKGYQPAATETQLRAAVTKSATPLASSLQLGHGRLDMAGAIQWIAPPTVPSFTSPAPATTVSGDQAVALTTTAPLVQLFVDGVKVGAPVDPAGSPTIPTWGLSEATHTFGASDCNLHACGATPTTTLSVTVDNTAPAVTAPASDGEMLQAATTFTATAPGGGVRFYVDNVSRGFDGSAPYELSFNASTLANGSHTLKVVSCNTAGTTCSGPFATRTFTVQGLHPSVVSAVSPFSPNGDKRRDTTTWTLRLPEPQTVSYVIKNSNGTIVGGPVNVGARAVGDHSFVWAGKQPNGSPWANGDYTITVTTTSGPSLQGLATRVVRLDTVAPVLTKVVGSSGWVFPVKDGYRDTLPMGVTVSESATVNLRIVNSGGTLVRSLWASRTGAGAVPFTWNGRYANGSAVPAGTYTFWFVANDPAQTLRKSNSYYVAVSWKKLVSKSATVYKNASAYYDGGSYSEYPDGSRASCSAAIEEIDASVTLANECDGVSSYGVAWVDYGFTLPAATSYTSLRFDTYGAAATQGTDLVGLVWNAKSGLWDTPREVGTSIFTGWTEGVCWPPGANHVQLAGRYARFKVAVFDHASAFAEYNFSKVRVIVSYKVLV